MSLAPLSPVSTRIFGEQTSPVEIELTLNQGLRLLPESLNFIPHRVGESAVRIRWAQPSILQSAEAGGLIRSVSDKRWGTLGGFVCSNRTQGCYAMTAAHVAQANDNDCIASPAFKIIDPFAVGRVLRKLSVSWRKSTNEGIVVSISPPETLIPGERCRDNNDPKSKLGLDAALVELYGVDPMHVWKHESARLLPLGGVSQIACGYFFARVAVTSTRRFLPGQYGMHTNSAENLIITRMNLFAFLTAFK